MLYGIDITLDKYKRDYENIYFDWQARQGINKEAAIEIAKQNIREKGLVYMSYPLSVKLAKMNQPWPDPTCPEKSDFGRELLVAVNDLLGTTGNSKQESKIKFYTATSREKKPKDAYSSTQEMAADHTPLDWYHKIDCFIEIGGDEKRNGFIVPMDLSLNREKVNPEAIIVPEIDVPAQGEPADNYLQEVKVIAEKVVQKIPDNIIKELRQSS